jgi:hypothetical protein
MADNLLTSDGAGAQAVPLPAGGPALGLGTLSAPAGVETEPFLSVRAWTILGACLVAYFTASYLTMLAPDSVHRWLIHEDHLIEGPGSLGLLAGAVFAFLLFRRTRASRYAETWPRLRRLTIAGLGVLFLLSFGEENDWGQRILGFGTPEGVKIHNHQGEFNAHNLNSLHGVLNPDFLFQWFWLGLFVTVPVAAALWPRARAFLSRALPIGPLVIAGILVFNQLFVWGFHRVMTTHPGLYNDTLYPLDHTFYETKESVIEYCMGLAFFLIWYRMRQQERAAPQRR